ncbi:hypothetical protein ACFRIC_09140 [Streptomyces sp. NPDC056738]|uniref:hypothetical protein n=1 Tax=Streptomyces sp. NPDC056738 TaxID=3345933 RepID=UPI0036B2C812
MSAPVTHDPLVVSTQDGSSWMRRAITRDGHGLYALAGSVAGAPTEVLSTIPELAADHGLRGMAFALPMPVGTVPRTLDQVEEELTGANLSLYEEQLETARLRLALASAQRGRRQQRDQVVALLGERHSTNESLTLAAEALRENRDRLAKLESAHPVMFRAAHDSIVMGYYTSAAEARKHCEAYVRREHAKTTELQLWWREDEDTLDQPEFGEAELIERTKSTIVPGPGMTRPTGYMVTPIEVSSAFDPDADE